MTRRHNFRFHLGTLESLDRARHELGLAPLVDDKGKEIAPRRAVAYDTLVIAVGSIVNDFRTPGVAEHAIALDSAADATRFHRLLLAACARAEVHSRGPVQIAIVGRAAAGAGGAAGGALLGRRAAAPAGVAAGGGFPDSTTAARWCRWAAATR